MKYILYHFVAISTHPVSNIQGYGLGNGLVYTGKYCMS